MANSSSTMRPLCFLFSYGTLQRPTVQLALFGRTVETIPDVLRGYAKTTIEIRDVRFAEANGAQQAIATRTGRESDCITGSVLALTDEELAAADSYEPEEYVRVLAVSAAGRDVWVYADGPASRS